MFNIFMSIHWTALFLFLVLALLGLWVAYSFLNKNGLFLFSIIAMALTFILPMAEISNTYFIPMSAILMPLIYFSILVVYEKYGREESKKLFIYLLSLMCTFVICNFFVLAYNESVYSTGLLSWATMGTGICQLISFILVIFLSNFLIEKFPIKKDHKYLRRSVLVALACVIDLLIVIMLGRVGVSSFVEMLVSYAISLIFFTGTSFAVAYLRKFLNRQPITETTINQEVDQNNNLNKQDENSLIKEDQENKLVVDEIDSNQQKDEE